MASHEPQFEELKESIRGEVYTNADNDFGYFSTIFNGNVKTEALAVVCPMDAEDISKIILFCVNHSLSPSVKAGGYGTAGWAIAGQVIIDLHHLVDLDIEAPLPDGGFTSLDDVLPVNSKGKGKLAVTPTIGKRRREDDVGLRFYDLASPVVAGFLRGEPLSALTLPELDENESDGEPPRTRSRLDPDLVDVVRSPGSNTGGLKVVETVNVRRPNRGQTQNIHSETTRAPANSDPFGYIQKQGGTASNNYGIVSSDPVAPPRIATTTVPSHPAPVHEYAYVTFGAGKRQKEIDIYTASQPLDATTVNGTREKVPYYVPLSAHPVGSASVMHGGFGFLSRLRGLSVDCLVEAEMVLADGRIVIVNEKSYPDLWWALRGAGPAYGIVTRYKAKAFPVPVVFAGNLIYRFRQATSPSLMKHFRDVCKGAPRELYANTIFTAGPEGKDSLHVIQMCYVGSKERGQEFLAALSSWNGEPCLLNEVHEKSFLHQQDSVAQVLRGKAGRQWFIRSALINSLTDEAIHQTVQQFADAPPGCTWLFELAGGAISDFEDTCLPKSQRGAAFNVAALHQWDMGVDDPRCVVSAEEWISGTLKALQSGGPLPGFLGRHESAERTISCYGENWSRLCEIKQHYDPKNLFRNCFWPVDTDLSPVEPQTHEPASP